jgi:hypothetical protein
VIRAVTSTIAALALAGCAQILGLDSTKLDRKDAATDAPSACDTPAIACNASTGRTFCGQLTVVSTGDPFRVAAPMGQPCGTTEGPCGLSVFGQPTAPYYQGVSTDRVSAQLDDCGHFTIADLDPTMMDVVIAISGPDVASSGRLLFDQTGSVVMGVKVPVVPMTTVTAWAGELGIAESNLATGFLVSYLTGTGDPVPMEEVRISGAAIPGPPTPPWASYFTGAFDSLDPALTATASKGTVFVAPPNGTFRLGGFHIGKQCFRDGFQAVSNTLLSVVLGGVPPGC